MAELFEMRKQLAASQSESEGYRAPYASSSQDQANEINTLQISLTQTLENVRIVEQQLSGVRASSGAEVAGATHSQMVKPMPWQTDRGKTAIRGTEEDSAHPPGRIG